MIVDFGNSLKDRAYGKCTSIEDVASFVRQHKTSHVFVFSTATGAGETVVTLCAVKKKKGGKDDEQ